MAKKYCNRCSHNMWYDETKKRWYCSNENCVKYKPQPEPEPAEEQAEESATDTSVSGKE